MVVIKGYKSPAYWASEQSFLAQTTGFSHSYECLGPKIVLVFGLGEDASISIVGFCENLD